VKRVLPWMLGVVVLTVVLVVGLTQAHRGDGGKAASFDLATAQKQLQGAPAPLAKLHAQSSTLLDGGVRAFDARLAALAGRPVVINKWASWCNPCRAEFPAFQQAATARGKQVAFLGVNGFDSTGPARRFLTEYPVPFPSYVDPDEKIARRIKAPANYPITVFVDRGGKTAFIHQGGYTTGAQLERDIDRYIG
jgi:thiol-disulfide isomerase/thioredoxin